MESRCFIANNNYKLSINLVFNELLLYDDEDVTFRRGRQPVHYRVLVMHTLISAKTILHIIRLLFNFLLHVVILNQDFSSKTQCEKF
jgi:hypothetical protein